ncbi:MAG: hypothetical protein NZ585_03965 [Chloracidobacterium sp.]|nr:hypothetical protein [Chloracidobacterium sp.]MDW8217487.1 hypothetical protein [Acidobacteriota bacterium]
MQPTPYSPPSQPAAKKSNIWLWVLVGCGSLTVLGVIIAAVVAYFAYYAFNQAAKNPVRTAAKVVELVNPDIEVISVDEEKQLVTFRDKKTGTVTTVSLEELQKQQKQGQSGGKPADDVAKGGPPPGSTTPGGGDTADLPNWVVLYPGAKVIAKTTSSGGDKVSGTLMLETDDTVEAVFRFYESKLDGVGFTVTRTTVGGVRALSATRNSGETITVTAFPEEPGDQEDTRIMLSYESR